MFLQSFCFFSFLILLEYMDDDLALIPIVIEKPYIQLCNFLICLIFRGYIINRLKIYWIVFLENIFKKLSSLNR